jgi:hypothetical protein
MKSKEKKTPTTDQGQYRNKKNPPTVPDKNLLTVSLIYFNLDKKK